MFQEIENGLHPRGTITPLFEHHEPIVQLARHGQRVLAVGAPIEVIRGLRDAGCQTTAVAWDEHTLMDATGYCERVIAAPFDELDCALELDDDRFDVVIVDGIENLVDAESVLLVTKQYVRPAGRLIASVQNAADAQLRLALLTGQLLPANRHRAQRTPARFYTRDAAIQLLVRAGFEVSMVERLKRPADERLSSTPPVDISTELLDALRSDPEAQTQRFLLVGQVSSHADVAFVEHRVRRLTTEVVANRADIASLAEQQADQLLRLDALTEQMAAIVDGRAGDPEVGGTLEHRLEPLESRLNGLEHEVESGLRLVRPTHPAAMQDVSKHVAYQRLICRIRGLVRVAVPDHATIAVVSRGDDDLLELDDRRACHFPQTDNGVYAGHYPATGAEAIDHLEDLRDRGVDYILFPETSRWWLDHYADLRQHLEHWYRVVVDREDTCIIFTPANP